MYQTRQLSKFNIVELKKVSDILYACGKDMAKKYDLHHWDNSRFKTWIIVALCALKNNMYLLYGENKMPVATFQTRKMKDAYLFQKLATLPEFSGSGVGTLCINEIERLAKNNGCKEVICEVYDKSVHAISFYEHRGYLTYETVNSNEYTILMMKKDIL